MPTSATIYSTMEPTMPIQVIFVSMPKKTNKITAAAEA